jgi:hypothetical protein
MDWQVLSYLCHRHGQAEMTFSLTDGPGVGHRREGA